MSPAPKLAAALAAIAAASACHPGPRAPLRAPGGGGGESVGVVETTRLSGDTALLGGGVVRAWAEVDGGGIPRAVGVSLPDSVVASVPDSSVMLSLRLPAVKGLPFRHVLFDWVPGGHPPADLYAAAHWDAHFYTISPEERRRIGAGEATQRPGPELMPEGVVPVPGLGLYSFPEMGVHWVHQDAPELVGEPFGHTLIYGSTGERPIFVEPMVTQARLAQRPDVTGPVAWPATVTESGFYPTAYVIRHEPGAAGFRLSLEGFRWREGTGGPGG